MLTAGMRGAYQTGADKETHPFPGILLFRRRCLQEHTVVSFLETLVLPVPAVTCVVTSSTLYAKAHTVKQQLH